MTATSTSPDRRGLLAACALASALSSGCEQAPAPAPQVLEPAAPQHIALTAHDGGALLAAGPGGSATGIDAWLLDEQGETRRHFSMALQGDGEVLDLQAVTSGERLTLAWQQRARHSSTLHTGHLDLSSGETARHPPLSSLAGDEQARGFMQLQVQPSGAERMLYAQLQAPCSGTDAPCLELAFGVPGADDNPAPRPRLAVPHPCEQPITAFSLTPQLWHYAVCSRESGVPTMTVFSAQPQPAYAQAQPLRAGCAGIGATRLGERLLISADCRDEQHTLFIVDGVEAIAEQTLRERALSCRDGVLELSLDGERHALQRNDQGLGLLLPADVAPAGAQALWTGSVLLVAQPEAEAIRLRTLSCSHNLLTLRELPSLRGAAQAE